MSALHPWLQDVWQRLTALGERIPHALLFVGPPGVGKHDLAETLAARLLCTAPLGDGHACGQCTGCALMRSHNHPDLFRLMPPADLAVWMAEQGLSDEAGTLAGDAAQGEPGAEGKALSSQILIEQVRRLQQQLTVTGHQGSRRVALIEPAEAMNTVTANGLLKLLEEPPEGCVFILVSPAPARLLPTIRSRCQVWHINAAAAAPPAASGDAGSQALLALSGGLPLAAQRLAGRGGAALLERFVHDVQALDENGVLALSARWEQWLKSREARDAGFGMPQLTDWMLRWVTDLATFRLGGPVRYFPAQAGTLARLAGRTSVASVTSCYNELARIRKAAQHSLNPRLMLDDMLLRYVRVVTGSRR